MTPLDDAPAARPSRLSKSGALKVEGLSKRFGGLQVFEGVTFTLAPGEILGVIGPNGAGKTTLINVICGRLPASGGRVFLGGADVTGFPFHRLSRMGVVRSFQQPNLFRSATVRENLSRAICFSGGTASRWETLEDLLRGLELAPRLEEQSDNLPYGLQRMLGLLLAFAARPTVLLLDEPAAGLERRERTRVDDFVHYVQTTQGCGVLIVEHDMDLIRRLCPRIIVLDAGKVLAEGSPETVLARRDVIDAYVGASEEETDQC